jgi:porin
MKLQLFVLFTIALVFFNSKTSLSQTDTTKENSFTFEASYIGDVVYNFTGGIKKGGTYLGMASIRIGFDTEKANLWKGGELFLHGANTHGGEPSATLIGDYQVASNIEAGNLTYIQELWYKQNIRNASVVLGLQDLCAEFIFSENASVFLNSSCGVPSTIAGSMPLPIFPLTALGLQFHYYFTENLIFKTAVFDGVSDDFSINPYNLKWRLRKDDGYQLFAEITYKNTSETYPGTYKLGGYYHNTYTINTVVEDALSISETYPSKYGFYIVLDQHIFKRKSGEELSVFLQASIKPKNINENGYYIGGGCNYKGMISKLPDDVLGLAITHARVNNTLGSETTIELTYKAQLGENFFLQPNLQYIINPAGTAVKLDNSLLVFLRFGINFKNA